MITFPYKAKALRVDQPLGTYYATVLPAELLLDVCFSDRLKAHKVEGGAYILEGTQRLLDEKRLKAIGGFISRTDSAFPNTIILAANSRLIDGLIEESEDSRWSVEANQDCGDFTITIPTKEKLSAIIDGQHRLFSFAYAPERLGMSLVCSVFFDLPKPFQAQLFATINSTQKPVDKSQTYELFGYNISEESESYWSPDKLAVFFARRLNTMDGSPLQGRIAIAPEADAPLQLMAAHDDWHVSMATIVEGILRLISTNPKQDSNELLDSEPKKRSDLARSKRTDHSPLRPLYIAENDKLIYLIVSNFLIVCKDLFWSKAQDGSFIVKTVGIQALFDVLRFIAPVVLSKQNASVQFFSTTLLRAGEIDFSTGDFRNASGSGRTAIRKAIQERLALPLD
jgi:DNA phosphorothioation-associated DGQHR protein 1